MKILLVDDGAEKLGWMFDFIGEVLCATNEEEARDIISNNQDIDIILMDGNLGIYPLVYGHEVVSRLRQAGVTTKIIMFSSDRELNEKGVACGAQTSFEKNIMAEDDWELTFQTMLDNL